MCSSASSDRAQSYLLELQSKGVGLRQAAKLAGLSFSSVKRVQRGARVRPGTAAAILGVRPVLARRAFVNAYESRRLIRAIQNEGYSNAEIARRLGLRSGRLRWDNKRVTVAFALKVRALWKAVSE